jgi:hypothetical protein
MDASSKGQAMVGAVAEDKDTRLIGRLMEGPLDIVGDVHGEIDALNDLLAVLGYDRHGRHPAGRRLVFVGDLCDRGPDSIAVMARVGELVDQGLAQCVLGNHELNLLRAARKEGNGWFFDDNHDVHEGKFARSRQADASQRPWIRNFMAQLPLALRSDQLRVVHACWDEAAVRQVEASPLRDVAELHDAFVRTTAEDLVRDGTMAQAERELSIHRQALDDPTSDLPFLPALARKNVAQQMSNPVRILTSGVERQASQPFYSSGKWRMVERAAWWDDYRDATPVVVGHYWRWPVPVDRHAYGKGGTDLFAGIPPHQGLGPSGNVHCVDYSVGRRFQERERGMPFRTRLAALRWPQMRMVFDDGVELAMTPSASALHTMSV